ncbi:SRPBCC family protein [Pseudolysinimonas sp.]|uniref:SRPBCC family protein n=1 Tax=Pseudolysinimonas sp. TaxID=2680009 RepID=UPI003F8067A7
MPPRGRRGVYVRIVIRAPLSRLWELTQDPSAHARWDLRFSRIVPVERLPTGAERFGYERRLPFHTIRGTGTSLGERRGVDGTATSALRFDTHDRLSPLGDGRGFWRYRPTDDGSAIVFTTGFDYAPGWGRLLDRLLLRRLIGWMTAWSFDRLRIWAEDDVPPERWPLRSALALWRRDRPRAARCERTPPHAHALADAPASLSTLEAP